MIGQGGWRLFERLSRQYTVAMITRDGPGTRATGDRVFRCFPGSLFAGEIRAERASRRASGELLLAPGRGLRE